MGSIQEQCEASLLTETGYAKVNLSLSIFGRRDDGYHQLSSLVAFADVGDVIGLIPEKGLSLEVSGPFAAQITGENLLMRVAKSYCSRQNIVDLGTITLVKNLPVAAGVGGGSSDAAALLRIFQRLRGRAYSDEDIQDFGTHFGADVPVCFFHTSALMEGIGEKVRPLTSFASDVGILLVNVGVCVSTGEVFKALEADCLPKNFDQSHADLKSLPKLSTIDDIVCFMEQNPNDLLSPALSIAPEIEHCLDDLSRLPGARIVRLSGSGATCFALFDGREQADIGMREIAKKRPEWWVRSGVIS